MNHQPDADRLLAHLRDRYGIDPAAATKLSVHKSYVFRIVAETATRGSPGRFLRLGHGPVSRAMPPSSASSSGRSFRRSAWRWMRRYQTSTEARALVTRFVQGAQLPDGAAKFAIMGELLGRLHALPYDGSVSRPGGASGEDPSREGTPRQDLLAALSFLDAVDTKGGAHRAGAI